METFPTLQAICAGNSVVTGEFPAQRPVTPSFDVFFDLRLNKRLSKQSWGWWFETLSRPLWRSSNVTNIHDDVIVYDKKTHQACRRRYMFVWFTWTNLCSRTHKYDLLFRPWPTQRQLWRPIILLINSSPVGENGRHFADDIFRCIFMDGKFLYFD